MRNYETPKVALITPSTPERMNNFFVRTSEVVERLDYKNLIRLGDLDNGTIGAKRNSLCARAIEYGADIICHFDDDDWYSPDYINICVNKLKTCDVTGLSEAYFYRPHSGCWLYKSKMSQPYVIGSGMAYWADVWQRNPFKDIMIGEDNEFLKNAGIIQPHNQINSFLAILHSNNTSSKVSPSMKPVSTSIGKQILGDMYQYF